jgi:uncharacterized protein YkwD
MATNDFLSHTGSDGSNPFERMEAAGFPIASAGENVAAGQNTPAAVLHDWLNSPGHRANILGAGFAHLGVGYAQSATSRYGDYWSTSFGTATDGGLPSESGCHP